MLSNTLLRRSAKRPQPYRLQQTIDGETIYSVYGVGGDLIFRDNVTTGETTDYLRLVQSGPTLVRLKTQAGVVTPTCRLQMSDVM